MGKIYLNGVDYSAPNISGVTGVKGNAENTYRVGKINITPEDIGALPSTGGKITGNLQLDGYLKGDDGQNPNRNHALSLGHNGQNHWDFYEYGGIYNFYKSKDGADTLIGKITENGWEGNVKGNADSATKAVQDGSGNNIVETYAKKTDVLSNNAIVDKARAIVDPRSGNNNTLSYDGTITDPAYLAAWDNNRTVNKYAISNLDNRYYTESEIDTKLNGKSNSNHTHDDRYYTESEIDNLFKTMTVPAGLGSIKSGQYRCSYAKGNDPLFIDLWSTESVYKRSACIITSLYMNAGNSNTNYVSILREIAVHQIDHTNPDNGAYTDFAEDHQKVLYSYSSNTQNVTISGKHKWLLKNDTDDADGISTVAFHMPTITAANFTSGVIYISWAVIM